MGKKRNGKNKEHGDFEMLQYMKNHLSSPSQKSPLCAHTTDWRTPWSWKIIESCGCASLLDHFKAGYTLGHASPMDENQNHPLDIQCPETRCTQDIINGVSKDNQDNKKQIY